jgi:hypothetical protein
LNGIGNAASQYGMYNALMGGGGIPQTPYADYMQYNNFGLT